MTRFHYAGATGKHLHGKARTAAEVYIESNITITESPAGNGIYGGDTAVALNPGEHVAVYDVLTSDVQPVGFGVYDYTNEKVVSDIVVQDITGISDMIADILSDTTVIIAKANSDTLVMNNKANSDMSILKSDIAFADAVIDKTYSDTAVIIAKENSNVLFLKSDIVFIQSNVVLIDTHTKTQTHEYHLTDE